MVSLPPSCRFTTPFIPRPHTITAICQRRPIDLGGTLQKQQLSIYWLDTFVWCSATSPPRMHSVPCSSWAVYIPTDFDVWRSIVRAVRSSLLAACEEASINAACVASTLLKHGAPTARWRRSACGSACGRRSRSKGLGAWCFDGKSVVRGGVSNHVAQERLRYAAQSPHSQVASAPRRLTLFPFSELDRGRVHLRTLGVKRGLRDREQSIEVAWCT